MHHPPKKQLKPRSRKRLAWVTMIVLVLAASLVAFLPAIHRMLPAQKLDYEIMQSTVRTIGIRSAQDIASITIWPDGLNSYTLHMQNGTLMLERKDGLEAIDETYQADLLELFTEISVQNTVADDAAEAMAEWDAMGLLTPQGRAEVRYQDGSEETMEVGVMAHGNAEYYFRWSGAPGIYLCHSGVLELLTTAESVLLPFEQIEIQPSLVQELRIQNANGACVFSFENGSAGQLIQPHRYPITDETAETLLTALDNFRLGSYEAVLTDENRAAYGFDDPVCMFEVVQKEGVINVITPEGSLSTAQSAAQNAQFVIGRAEGEFFYTCAYQEKVYLISRFLAETLVQASWEKLISHTPAAMGDSSLTDIVFETPDQTIEIHIERTESVLENNKLEVDADGNLVYLTTVTINGQEAPQEKLDILLDSLNGFAVEGSIPANARAEQEPRWRVTLVAENDEIRVLEGYRLDVFSDAVAVNGVMCHYVYDEAIDVLMTGLV